MKTKSFSRGFTLIELLVVIAIIGILSTLLILQLNTARSKGRDAKRVADTTQLRDAVELYYDDNGSYPAAISDALIGKYMASTKAPLDPSTAAAYGYGTSGSPITKYQIWAELENGVADKGTLGSDADIPAGYTGGTNGDAEACTSAAADCVFDLGIQ